MSPNSQPPVYTYAYPQPNGTDSNPPSFRKRKSSTIIPITSSSSSSGVSSSSTSPDRLQSTLPDMSIQTEVDINEHQQIEYDLHRASTTTINTTISSPPSFKSVESASPIPPYVTQMERRSSNSSSAAEEGEATPLLGENSDTIRRKWTEGPLFVAGVKFSILFVVFTAVVVGTFWFGLPKFDPEDKEYLKLPRSFADLQALNDLFQKYKRDYPFRILICVVVTYLFIQTFTLPGSMYLSILFGAAYGPMKGLFLACFCDATGSILCYTLSSIVGPPLLTIPFYRARVETWRTKLMGDPKKGKEASLGDIFALLVVLRIAPFPPHWIPNFVAPHLGISAGLFWLSCFIGIAPISVIHVTIGSSLDTMTSAADFHLLSVRNILGLIAVVVAVLIPVGLKRVFKKDLGELGEAEEAIEEAAADTTSIDVPPVEGDGVPVRYQAIDSGVILAGPSRGDDNLDTGITKKGKGRALEIIADIQEEDEEDNYEVYASGSVAPETVSVRSEKHKIRPLKGYGSIERVENDTQISQSPGMFWPFAR